MDMDAALKEGYSLAEVNAEAARRTGFKYQDALKDGYSEEEINQELRKRLKSSGPSLGQQVGTGIKQAFAGVGNTVQNFGGIMAGGLAGAVGADDLQESIYRGMNEAEAARNKWANPDNIDVGIGGKVAGAVATLPLQIPTFVFSPTSTGKTAADAGESQAKVANAIGLDVVGNIAGALVGPGKSIYTSILKQAGANAAQDYLTKWITQQLMDTKKGKEAFDPSLVDATVSAIVGGGMGAATHQKPTVAPEGTKVAAVEKLLKETPEEKAPEAPLATPEAEQLRKNAASVEALRRQKELERQSAFNRIGKEGEVNPALEGLVPESPMERMTRQLGAEPGELPVRPDGSPMSRMAEDLQTSKLTVEEKKALDFLNAKQMEIDDTPHNGNAELPFTGSVKGIVPRDAFTRIDENGMPIRADLSMEAQNLQDPRQRNLWGDELPQKSEQENPLGITQALDTMPSLPWKNSPRDVALDRLSGESVKSPELSQAIAEASALSDSGHKFGGPDLGPDLGPLGSLERKAKVGAAKKPRGPKGQRGMISEDLLGVGKATEFIRAMIGKARDPLGRILEKYQGTFHPEAIADAYKVSRNPKEREHVVMMSPKDFNALAMERHPAHWGDKKSNESRGMAKRALETEDGLHALPQLSVDKNGKVVGHDGRHRMDILDANRVDAVPVRILHPDFTNDKFPHNTLIGQDTSVNSRIHRVNSNERVIDNSFAAKEKGPSVGITKGIPHAVEKAYLKALEARTSRLTAVEDPHNAAAHKQALTKSRNAFEKAVAEAGLDLKTTENNLAEMHGPLAVGPKIPFNFKKQGGGILLSGKAKQAVDDNPVLRGSLPELQRVADTPSGVITALKGIKDVTNNVYERSARLFTKGFLYEKFKTNHPLIKYAYDRISDAIDAAKNNTHKMLQEDLLPKLRSLSDAEMTELHGAMLTSMKQKKALSAEMLRQVGFNEKQIATWESFQRAYKQSLESINQARKDANLPPIDPYVGYMAGFATGDFRTLIVMKDKEGNPHTVGIVGANTKYGMEYRVKKILAEHPEYSRGETKYFGNRGNGKNSNSLAEALTILSDKDPNVLAFVDQYANLMQKDAYDFHNAARHTMAKKGVFGMEGDKSWKTAGENAFEGFEAQVKYIETMAKWAEMSKASKDLSEVLSDPDVQKYHPNAVAMSQEYLKNALGFNTSDIGNGLTKTLSAIGESTGLGTHYFNKGLQGVKGGLNTVFFALRPAFLIPNFLQSFFKTPMITNLLRSRGFDVGTLTTTGHTEFMQAAFDGLSHIWGKDTDFSKRMWDYGHEHGISTTQIFEHSTDIRKGVGHYKDKILEAGMSSAESVPRSIMYAMVSNILAKNGYANHPDIFKMAREVTDIAMGDYRQHEAQRANKMAGPLAPLLGNLSTYAANENSTIALLAREGVRNKSVSPIIAALLTGAVLHGVMGFPGFQEADWLFHKVTGWMGKPRTLSDVVLSNAGPHGAMGDGLALGMPAAMGIDLHNLLGRSSALPAIFGGGGAGAALDIGKQAVETIKSPNEMNAKRLMYMADPVGFLKGPMDLAWFSKETKKGNLSLDKRPGHAQEGQYYRGEFDTNARKAGFTSTSEFKAKEKLRQQQGEDVFYAEKQKKIVSDFFDTRASSGYKKGDLTEAFDQYVEAEGDPKVFVSELTKHGIAMNTSSIQRYLLQKAQSGNLRAMHALQRWNEKTYSGADQ